MDWSAIYMRSVFASDPSSPGSRWRSSLSRKPWRAISPTATWTGTRRAWRPRPAFCMAVGILLVRFLSPLPVLSLLRFALIGIGTSAIFPLAISAAAQRTDRPAAINVAALAQISFVVFLLGPPLLGFVAEHWGLRWTFGLGVPLVALSFALAEHWTAATAGLPAHAQPSLRRTDSPPQPRLLAARRGAFGQHRRQERAERPRAHRLVKEA